MYIKRLLIYSYKEDSVIKQYNFNPVGLNIILGEKKDLTDEANGVGKTEMINSIRYILSDSRPQSMTSDKFIEKDIFIVLELHENGKPIYLGRRFKKKSKGYIYKYSHLSSFEEENWIEYPAMAYKDEVTKLFFGEEYTGPKIGSVMEIIARDEKNGFTQDLIIPNRNSLDQYRILSYLFSLDNNSEKDIEDLKEQLRNLKKERDRIDKVLSRQIKDLKIEEAQLVARIDELQIQIKSINIPRYLDEMAINYGKKKEEINIIQKKLFELNHIRKQYKKNIDNLKEKVNEIKKLNDVKTFYKQLMDFFPKKVEDNFDKIKQFYDYMVDNRGEYYQLKCKEVEVEIKELTKREKDLHEELGTYIEPFKNEDIISDIAALNNELLKNQVELKSIQQKINEYNKINEINDMMNDIQNKINLMTKKKYDGFKNYEDIIRQHKVLFNQLLEKVYGEKGVLEFKFNNNTNLSRKTGRIDINCYIEDEEAHGRLYMKVNMFDLTWFLNKLSNDNKIEFLIHDGSYSKPDRYNKTILLKEIHKRLKDFNKGQYIVTINSDELDDKDIKDFNSQNIIVTNLNRFNSDKNRLYGFRY